MSYAQCEFDATDEAGNLLSNVSVEVRRQPGLTLEPLYSDREGASNLANPFTATDGKVKFFAAGGAYRIVLTAGSYTRTRDYVAVGRAAETDLLLTSPKGAWSSGSTYSKGDLVSVAVGTLTRLFASVQNSNTNHTPDSSTPGDTSWWMYVGTVAGTASAPGITLTYDSTTVAADPGNGKFRLNNATHSSATALYADNVEALAGASITSLLDSWDDSTSTVKGRLKIAKASDPTVFRIYSVTGSVVDSSGYRTITISYVTGAGSLSNSDQCVFTFLATGDKGNIGGSTGSTDNRLLRSDGTGGATLQNSAITVDDSGNISGVGTFNGYTPREVLTGNRTYYVRTDGSDSNDGLSNTSGGAFLTPQKAVDAACALDLSIYSVTIQVGAGTRTATVTPKSYVGTGPITIVGDETTPSNVTMSVTGGNCFTLNGVRGKYVLAGMKLTTTTSGNCIDASNGSAVDFRNIEFGACPGQHIICQSNANVSAIGNYAISGGGGIHTYSLTGGCIIISGKTVTITNTPALTFAQAVVNSVQQLNGNTYSGTTTGVRYSVSQNSVIHTNGGGSTYLPGNSAGVSATGGQYT